MLKEVERIAITPNDSMSRSTLSYIAVTAHSISTNRAVVNVVLQTMHSLSTVLRSEERKRNPNKKDVSLLNLC